MYLQISGPVTSKFQTIYYWKQSTCWAVTTFRPCAAQGVMGAPDTFLSGQEYSPVADVLNLLQIKVEPVKWENRYEIFNYSPVIWKCGICTIASGFLQRVLKFIRNHRHFFYDLPEILTQFRTGAILPGTFTPCLHGLSGNFLPSEDLHTGQF